jgi:hypothetical protein
MPSYPNSHRRETYKVRHVADGVVKTSKVGYLQHITDQDRDELPALLSQEYGLTEVEVLDVTPA